MWSTKRVLISTLYLTTWCSYLLQMWFDQLIKNRYYETYEIQPWHGEISYCMFSPSISSAQDVENIPEREMALPSAPTDNSTTDIMARTEVCAQPLIDQDFPNLPISRPEVWSQAVAKRQKAQDSVPLNMPQQLQDQIMVVTTQVIQAQLQKTISQILEAVLVALKSPTPQ